MPTHPSRSNSSAIAHVKSLILLTINSLCHFRHNPISSHITLYLNNFYFCLPHKSLNLSNVELVFLYRSLIMLLPSKKTAT